jgi:hypothetical protein
MTIFEAEIHNAEASMVSGDHVRASSDREGLVLRRAGSAAITVMRRVFDRFDVDRSGEIDLNELKVMVRELGVVIPAGELKEFMAHIGGSDMKLSFEEFEQLMHHHATSPPAPMGHGAGNTGSVGMSGSLQIEHSGKKGGAHAPLLGQEEEEAEAEAEDEEEDEEEDEHAGMSPLKLKMKAFSLVLVGLGLVTLFSDPLCDVLSNVGTQTGIPAFYISFVLTPLVSNASELISSLMFAQKKSANSITITFSQLVGASTMNNSFCLSLFLLIVYMKNIPWNFTAEVIAILAVEAAVFAFAQFRVPKTWHAIPLILLYPASLVLVATLKANGIN